MEKVQRMTAGKVYTLVAFAGVVALTGVAWRSQERRIVELEEQLRSLNRGAPSARPLELARASAREHTPEVVVTPPSRAAPAVAQGTEGNGERAVGDRQPPDDADTTADAPSTEDQAAYVEAVFTEQVPDPIWSRESERQLGGGLRARLGSSQLDSLQCHETLCRAQLSHGDPAKYSEFVDRLIGTANELWRGPIFALKDDAAANGRVGSTIYFCKEGESLPTL